MRYSEFPYWKAQRHQEVRLDVSVALLWLTYGYSKRTGLEKAIFQIEEAIKKSKVDTVPNEGAIVELQRLLEEARSSLPHSADSASPANADFASERDGRVQSSDEQLALDDAENPLQLLARASDLRLSTTQSSEVNTSTPSTRNLGSEPDDRSDIHQFFLPMKASWDGGEGEEGQDRDPINVGLVTVEEAKTLLSLYEFSPLWHGEHIH